MSTVTLKRPIAKLLDQYGLVNDFSSWSEELARELATEEGIPALGEKHWSVIRALRSEYAKIAAAPSIRNVCREAGVERSEINDLFGYCLVAWRVAGLPNPGEEAKSYLGSM